MSEEDKVWSNFLAEIKERVRDPEARPLRLWIHGKTGTKKTYFARKLSAELGCKVYNKKCSKSWQGFENQKIVLIDDLDKKQMEYVRYNLSKWMDYYEFTGYVISEEGTEPVMIDAGKYHLIITSNYPPEAMDMEEKLRAKFDRIFEVKEFPLVN